MSGDLVFSVGVFCTCAVLCLCTLSLRRVCVGYELGGDACAKYSIGAFFAALWFVYIGLSICSTLDVDVSAIFAPLTGLLPF